MGRNEVAELTLRTKRPVAFDIHADIIATGRFVIVDGFEVAGGGIVAADNYPRRTADSLQKSHNIYWSHGQGHLRPARRAQRPSRAGRLADRLVRLRQIHHRHRIWSGSFSTWAAMSMCSTATTCATAFVPIWAFPPGTARKTSGASAKPPSSSPTPGIICITAFISPYRSDRDMVRQIMEPGKFVEVYVNAPLEVCEARDPKGLYAKARAHQIKDFTGISAPYEAPANAELELATDNLTVAESVARIIEYLQEQDDYGEISI